MGDRPRIVADTNVLVSGMLAPRSVPGEAVRKATEGGRLLFSADTLAELKIVVAKPKFDAFVAPVDRQRFLRALGAILEIVPILQTVRACRDPDDDSILEVAVNGAADVIVTGDRDLLVLHPFRNIPIVTPAAYLATGAASPG